MQILVRKMIYPAPMVQVDSPAPGDMRDVLLEIPGNERVHAWYHQADSAAPVLLFFHGNGENLQTLWLSGMFQELDKLAVNYMALDYPGYGQSGGIPSESTLLASARSAAFWLKKYHPHSPLVLCGWSLGASVAILLTADAPELVSGLIALSPWRSLTAVAQEYYPDWLVNRLLKERYDSEEAAEKIKIPVLICHGTQDQTIPVTHSRTLAKKFPYVAKYLEIESAGHADLLSYPEVWQTIQTYIDVLKKSQKNTSPF